MFSPISFKKGPLAQKALSFFFILCLVIGTAAFVGCKTEDDDTGTIVGTWKSSFNETWTITATTVTADKFAGTISNSPNFEAPEGVIIIKYTQTPEYYDYDPIGGPYPPPGNFYAIYWKSLTTNSIELANAWDINDWSHNGAPETTTLTEAEEKFTLDNAELYAGTYSACEKQ
jgi:hypothetical protein